jgi:serine/threonine-protein kinase
MSDPLRERVVATLGTAYELEAEVGRGGMGVVYRCLDRKLRRHVAIKVLPPDLAFRAEVRTRFLREAETAAQLNHPNIVPIYSVDDRDGLVWFVMALVDGESLAARLTRERRPPLDVVRRILAEVADALAYAHARGIVHRDIKPDNILLDRVTGRPMVTDFGIARAAEGDSRLTVTGVAVGTPAYMSPEQATGERDIDGRSDLYSLAVVGYQMLAGDLPFQAANTPAMLMKHIADPVRPLRLLHRDVPKSLAAAVERALAKKPNERWPGAAEFRDAVLASPDAPETEAPAPNPERVSAAWKRPALNDAPRPLPRLRPTAPRRGPPPRATTPRYDRDAIDAANAGWRRDDPPVAPPDDPAEHQIPPWMPPGWGDVRRNWRYQDRDTRRRDRLERRDTPDVLEASSRVDSIRRFRRRTATSAVTVGMLAGINAMFTPVFPWFLFPAFGLSIGLLHHGAKLWADGVRFTDVFGSRAQESLRNAEATRTGRSRPLTLTQQAELLAPRAVVAGPYGETVRRAAADQAAAVAALAKLTPADRGLLPDVEPTVKALAERVGSLAVALHGMDDDVTPAGLAAIEAQISEARAQPVSPQRDRKLELLERRKTTLSDLLQRRETLKVQLESASLMLQNMRLDLLALGSAGVQSAINDVSTATQEARALSRDIQIALEAAREVR